MRIAKVSPRALVTVAVAVAVIVMWVVEKYLVVDPDESSAKGLSQVLLG